MARKNRYRVTNTRRVNKSRRVVTNTGQSNRNRFPSTTPRPFGRPGRRKSFNRQPCPPGHSPCFGGWDALANNGCCPGYGQPDPIAVTGRGRQ